MTAEDHRAIVEGIRIDRERDDWLRRFRARRRRRLAPGRTDITEEFCDQVVPVEVFAPPTD